MALSLLADVVVKGFALFIILGFTFLSVGGNALLFVFGLALLLILGFALLFVLGFTLLLIGFFVILIIVATISITTAGVCLCEGASRITNLIFAILPAGDGNWREVS